MRFILTILFSLLNLPAAAQCVGENLLDTMSAADRADLDKAIAAHPYPSGNLWKARKGNTTIHIMGTIHLSDERLASYLSPLWPILNSTDLVLLEANRESMAQLKSKMLSDPSLMFVTDGPTLPERLSDKDWELLTSEMSIRGVPGFLASKMQPWYVSMMLAIPPCAMAGVAEQNGVDQRIMAHAAELNIPARALEPYDIIFSLLGGSNSDEELSMLRMSLATSQNGDAMFATMIESYLAGEHRAIWELGRYQIFHTPGLTQEDAAKMFSEMETALLTDRNANWMEVILPATEWADNILIAVGAAHLSGNEGLLFLLEQAGYTLTRIDGF